ncbi:MULTISPECIES: M23 family metallopeptidase [unclassified Microbacterium]|uniref:M23 family metallopeptidase n=1 Tax=unclassified Microbacterium TaxID=2609290 RepID=UPI00097F599B|nr:M23 family metallopeptidase [Microbacterium sp. JB110]SJM46194.1 Membrane proteins related to metalloendopeptidases [Frigoribacterium sp. JB110]
MTHTDSSAGAPDAAESETLSNGASAISRRDMRRAEREFRAGAKKPQSTVHPVRSLATVGAVLALLAGVAIPAYAATSGSAEQSDNPSAHELAEQNAQTLSVGEGVKADDLEVSNYAATTPEEIEEQKAAEAAKRAAKAAAAEKAASTASSGTSTPADIGDSSVEPVGGAVNPLPAGSYYISRTVGGGHAGADMVAPGGTPIYAAKSGTVTVSSEGYFGYGVAVKIQHGDGTETLYGHMTYGSRQVAAGQQVSAGQAIGAVGNTGRSYGAHLHFEYHINGAVVDPVPYFGL